MFSVGRYDPKLDNGGEQEQAVNHLHSTSTSKRKRNNGEGRNSGGDRSGQKIEIKREKHLKEIDADDIDHDCDESSSSCPSSNSDDDGISHSGSSSSSVPSSDDDSNDDSIHEDMTPALSVIAAEQKENSIDIMRKRPKTTNEAIDDFDHDRQNQLFIEQNDEVNKALRMSKVSIEDAARVWDLAPFLVKNLERDQYKSFFPIQALVIPDVIASERHVHIRNRDVCVSSPTGSGKTLAFVIPVLNSLARRKIRRLRALVVLPSRDLATQVYDVFERYAQGSDLRIGLAIGQNDFEAEQRNLTIGNNFSTSKNYHRIQHALQPFSLNNALQAFSGDDTRAEITGCTWAQTNLKRIPGLSTSYGGISSVDVMVCTPGRLIDHLDKTPGFTLQHLRFLVIDEADRLVNQSYQNWIQRVIDAASVGPENIRAGLSYEESAANTSFLRTFDPVTWRKEVDSIDDQITTSLDLRSCIDSSVCRHVQLRKFLFSATLTKDPKKLTSLGLVNPKQFNAHQLNNLKKENQVSTTDPMNYSLPGGLTEFILECTAEQKPLVLLAVLLEQGLLDKDREIFDGITVVFTSSKDSTHRLARLLQLLWGAAGYGSTSSVAEFSGALNQKQRAEIMLRCNGQVEGPGIQVIVCSDGMSRGMDIQSVSAVINYDVPAFAKTYVHRCGRTARAGKKGRAITILKAGQVSKFLKMRQLIGSPEKVTKMGIKKELVQTAIPVYQKCIKALQNVMDAESNNELSFADFLGPEWLA